MNSTQSSGKRQAETIELVPVPKRQATESSLASPKSCSPSRIAALSRDTSFNSLDKGKVKIAHQTYFGNRLSIDIRETAHPSLNGSRVQTPKGKNQSLVGSLSFLWSYSHRTMHRASFNLIYTCMAKMFFAHFTTFYSIHILCFTKPTIGLGSHLCRSMFQF